ncbi:hypothetical protein WJ03_26110 [Burkholderia vietnamiensis]|jgi:hypothetical protein|nr:hypothetical protein WJ03_26110 [Burkholderia vietnamiensis]
MLEIGMPAAPAPLRPRRTMMSDPNDLTPDDDEQGGHAGKPGNPQPERRDDLPELPDPTEVGEDG